MTTQKLPMSLMINNGLKENQNKNKSKQHII